MSATIHETIRLTMAQALVRYLSALRTEEGESLFGGAFAIFGHGNVAGLGEALSQYRAQFPTYSVVLDGSLLDSDKTAPARTATHHLLSKTLYATVTPSVSSSYSCS